MKVVQHIKELVLMLSCLESPGQYLQLWACNFSLDSKVLSSGNLGKRTTEQETNETKNPTDEL